MSLLQLVYVSRSAIDLDLGSVNAIINVARERNRERNVTGLLCISAGHFLQVLEGDGQIVTSLLHKISQDPRHTELCILGARDSLKRDFSDWHMGAVAPSGPENSILAQYSISSIFDPYELSYDSAISFLKDLGRSENVDRLRAIPQPPT